MTCFSSTETFDTSNIPRPPIVISEREYLELKSEVGYWKNLHTRALKREKEAEIKNLKNRIFGKKSEKTKTNENKKDENEEKSKKRKRGQKAGSKGHGRTIRPNLTEKEETHRIPKTPICPKCGKEYQEDKTKEGEILEVEVKGVQSKKVAH